MKISIAVDDCLDADEIKMLILDRLMKDGAIEEATAVEYAQKWRVIVYNKNWFQRALDVVNMRDNGKHYYKFVKAD